MRISALGMLLAITACAGPSPRFDRDARELGLVREEVAGAGFTHAVYRALGIARGNRLHVYLEGDGTPWIDGRHAAVDPTPRSPVALRLMTRDPEAALLLGRPCYNGHYADAGCGPALWTDARYSEAVVDSMARALEAVRPPGARLTLIGHSGGGTLAMLLAERVAGVDAVVTIAGNLDLAAWARRHGYEPLSASLDPSARAPLPPHIRQIHFAGERDREVPPQLVASAARRQPGARFELRPGFDHACCWLRDWPGLLASTVASPESASLRAAYLPPITRVESDAPSR
jgi:pimeloyl-ACP methyl ester carboxylesterase